MTATVFFLNSSSFIILDRHFQHQRCLEATSHLLLFKLTTSPTAKLFPTGFIRYSIFAFRPAPRQKGVDTIVNEVLWLRKNENEPAVEALTTALNSSLTSSGDDVIVRAITKNE
jgi:hypothetical protein